MRLWLRFPLSGARSRKIPARFLLSLLGAVLVAGAVDTTRARPAPPPGWTADYLNHPSPNENASTFAGEILRNEAETVVLKYDLHHEISNLPAEVALHVALTVACPDIELVHLLATAHAGVTGLKLAQKLVLLRKDEEYNQWLYFWFARYDPHPSYTFRAPDDKHTGRAFIKFNQKYQALAKPHTACSSGPPG